MALSPKASGSSTSPAGSQGSTAVTTIPAPLTGVVTWAGRPAQLLAPHGAYAVAIDDIRDALPVVADSYVATTKTSKSVANLTALRPVPAPTST